MKDYTKYDFAAIVGAEVSILLKSKVEYGGTLILASNKAIFLLLNDNPMALEGRWFAIEDIVPGSLSARIKVEDMSLKQLKRCAKQEVGNDDKDAHIGMGVNVDVFYIQANFNKRQGYLFDKEYDLTDYIDCTDWGWTE